MKALRGVMCVLAVAALSGCAFTKATLDVGLKPTDTTRGPLSAVAPATFKIADLADKRPDIDRIGYKRNGFGNKTADIVAAKPVPAIVRDAITAQLAANGHRVSDAADLIVSGDVTTFWFDITTHMASFDFTGTVAANLSITDAQTGQTLMTRAFQGYYSEKSMAGLEGTWQRIMNTALERMVREVATDPRLVAALRTRAATKSAARDE